jgi:hypothetical protein
MITGDSYVERVSRSPPDAIVDCSTARFVIFAA